MNYTFENKLELGTGIYTMPDIAQILRMPNYKVNRWVNKYWDGKLGAEFNRKYSWTVNNSKAVSFHTLIEFYTFFNLNEAGVKTNAVLKAHSILSSEFNTTFPFADAAILKRLGTDGRKIFLDNEDNTIIILDGTYQLNFQFIKLFFKKLDFGDDNLAIRLWPLGKEKNIVCDPQRQFGHPVIGDTNIYPETIYNLHLAGESIKFISFMYELEKKDVKDAIEYCKAA